MTKADKPLIVLIGASYVRHWNIKELNGISVINKGVDGQQTFEVLNRFAEDVVNEKPEQVMIWGFINNIHRNPKEQIDRTLKGIKEDIKKMVNIATDNGITPVLATEVTIRPKAGWKESMMNAVGAVFGKESYQDYVNSQVRAVNVWLRNWAKARGMPVLDFEAILSSDGGERIKEYATPDGSHISKPGYAALTGYASQHLPLVGSRAR